MANVKIKTVSNQGDSSEAEPLARGAEILAPGKGNGIKLSKLGAKCLVAGKGELVEPDRTDRQLKKLVGPRKVIGRDDRIRISDTSEHPWRMICHLMIESPTGNMNHGTGWLAGPKTVITAGHCVYDKKAMGGWATSVFVIPARNNDKEPYGKQVSKLFSTTDEWISNHSPEFDIAAIHLSEPIDETLGWFGIAALQDKDLKSQLLNVTGYPSDKGSMEMWHDRNKVVGLNERRIQYQADTEKGQSGSPVYIFPEGLKRPPVVVGVHAYGATEEEQKNSATRMTPQLAGVLRSWILGSDGTGKIVDAGAAGSIIKSIPPTSRRVIYIPSEATQQKDAAERKKHWDETLFGHSLGARSTLFHYAKEIPELDVPIRPNEPTMDAVGDALEQDIGKGAAKFAKSIGDAIVDTDENPLLFGLEQSIRWLGLSTRYFMGNGGLYRKRVAEEFIRQIANVDDEEALLVTHGFGAVVAFDLLTTYRDQLPTSFRVTNLITLGSPLGYGPFREIFVKEAGKRSSKQTGKLEFPRGLNEWFDVAIREDPLASDKDLFPSIPQYTFKTAEKVVAKAVEEFFADAYLKLPSTKSFVKRHLPRGFGAPVSKFLIAKDVADELSDTHKRVDVLIELDSKLRGGPETSNLLKDRAKLVVKVLREIATETDGDENKLSIDLMHRYVAAQLLPEQLRLFELRCQEQGEGAPQVHHVWRNAEVRALTHRSVRVVQVDAARSAYSAYGDDIQWAVLDTGVDAEHPHFKQHDNIIEALDFTVSNAQLRVTNFHRLPPSLGGAERDTYGHGTHVAGIIAGEFEDQFGMAPRAKLRCYKVIGDGGSGRESATIRALEHVYAVNAKSHKLKIHGVNLSIGSSFDPTVYACGHSPMCKEIRRLWEQGVVVCVAAGNAGMVDFDPEGADHLTINLALSIGDPANVQESIAVGSVHKTHPHSFGISYFSSRGPTADGRAKPDCVAPGERIRSASAGERVGDPYRSDSGTSMACPHVSGLIAAFLSVRREFIGQPDVVKQLLLDNCTDIGRDKYHQGAGVPNLMKMLSNA